MATSKTVLITGGSSGIGYEMSIHFGRAGYRLLWVSKSQDELTQAADNLKAILPEVELHLLAKDLSEPAACREAYEWAKQIASIDVLINNAGFGTYGFLPTTNMEKELAMIRLNVLAVYQLTRLFLDDMMAKDAGTIINISSNSSFQPVARMITYASTKAFITHFSRGLQEELALQGSHVRVMTVCPSAITDTPFSKDMKGVKTFTGLAYTTAAEVAQDVWNGFQKGKTFQVSGYKMRLFYAIRNWVPYSLQQYLTRRETEWEDA